MALPALYTAYGLSYAPSGAASPSAGTLLLPGPEMPTATARWQCIREHFFHIGVAERESYARFLKVIRKN